MIIQIDSAFVDDAARNMFELLRSDQDILVDRNHGDNPMPSHLIETESLENGMVSVAVRPFGLRYEVSEEEAKEKVLDVVGMLLGYQRTVLHGFTVMSSGGCRTKPRVSVFVRSLLGFHVPEAMEYVKSKDIETPAVPEDRSAQFVSASPVIQSLLSRGPLKFSHGDREAVFVACEGRMYMVLDSIETMPMIYRTVSSANADLFLGFVKTFGRFGFVDTIIKAYQSPLSERTRRSLKVCFVDLRAKPKKAELGCIREIVSAAPVFLDARDRVTEKLEKFYSYSSKGYSSKKTGYLSCRTEECIDRMPLGSLKRHFRGG